MYPVPHHLLACGSTGGVVIDDDMPSVISLAPRI